MTNPFGEFVPDPLHPSGFRWKRYDEPEPTGLLPSVGAIEESSLLLAVESDHDDLELVEPDEFPSFDSITSLMIRSIGAPDEH